VRNPFVHLRFTGAERVVGPTCIHKGHPHVGLPFWFAKKGDREE